MNDPTPRHIAHAIADLATGQVRAAWSHLDTWAALEAGGVPAEQLRDVLDRKLIQTEAVTDVRQWVDDGERGAFVIHGAQDNGKTFAAAWWALTRHERGLSTMWISAAAWGRLTFDEIRPLLRRAEGATALVIDDAGAGNSQGEHFRRTIEALLLERGGRPTLITGNLNEVEMIGDGRTPGWLGARIVSRLKVSGGRKHIATSLGMRQRDLDGVCAETGHGTAWERAAELVAVIGCERTQAAVMRTEYDDHGGSWEEPTGEYREHLEVGRELESRAERMTKLLDLAGATQERQREVKLARRALLRKAAKLAGLDPAEVKAHAAELVGTVSDLDGASVLDAVVAKLATQMTEMEKVAALSRREENEYRAKVCYDTLEEMTQRPSGPPQSTLPPHEAPRWTRGTDGVTAMRNLGYFTRQRSDGVDLYHRKTKGAAGRLVVPHCKNERDAWQACGLLWGSGWPVGPAAEGPVP